MLPAPAFLFRVIAGVLVGAAAWPALHAVLPRMPELIRFLLGWWIFTFGPGIAVSAPLTGDLDPLRRTIIALGVGSAAAAVLIDVLGRLHLIPLFPYVAAAMMGAGLACWPAFAQAIGPELPPSRDAGNALRRTCRRGKPQTERGDLIAAAALVLLAAGIGAIVFWQRMASTADGILLFGDYDTADLSWYAAVAAEASHTVPPTASYYSGHQLNAAYYAHLVLAMVSRFCGVPILSMFFRYGWPTFDAVVALTAFALVRSVASRGVAVLAVVFILVGSDFSYLAAWFLPHAAIDWDYLLWPTNFLSPTMQVLHFATWSPSLPVYFTALVAIVRGLQTRSRGWLVLSAMLIAVLFQFKPFCYVVLMGALCASALFAGGDWTARRRYLETVALTIFFTLPFLWGAATMDPADRRTRLVIDFFLLPKRMLIKIDLTDAFARAASRLAVWSPLEAPLFLLMATVVFLLVGIGVRWLGIPAVWRVIRRPDGNDAASWRLLAWVVVSGIGIPFVLTTSPYVDTLQFYLAGLYLLWVFTAVTLVGWASTRPLAGGVAIAVALAASLPSSLHYLDRKLTDRQREPRVGLTRSEVAIANHLRTTDPEKTVILHDRPLTPSLTAIVAARRIVLGWDVRYSAVGGEGRLREVNRFYSSADGDPAAAAQILGRYQVTHVIVRSPDDRVHPAILAKLKLILKFPDVALYEVPAGT
jgi:hypothetical protein